MKTVPHVAISVALRDDILQYLSDHPHKDVEHMIAGLRRAPNITFGPADADAEPTAPAEKK